MGYGAVARLIYGIKVWCKDDAQKREHISFTEDEYYDFYHHVDDERHNGAETALFFLCGDQYLKVHFSDMIEPVDDLEEYMKNVVENYKNNYNYYVDKCKNYNIEFEEPRFFMLSSFVVTS